MGNNSVPKFILRLSRFPVYRGSVLGRFYCISTLKSNSLCMSAVARGSSWRCSLHVRPRTFQFKRSVSARRFGTSCIFLIHPAFEDGTDTGFRNVGQLQFDAGEIPRRKYTIFTYLAGRSEWCLLLYQSSSDVSGTPVALSTLFVTHNSCPSSVLRLMPFCPLRHYSFSRLSLSEHIAGTTDTPPTGHRFPY